MRRVIRAFDAWLARTEGVYVFTQSPDCILRLRKTRTKAAIQLPGQVIEADARILEVHLWNERIPPIPPQGPDMAWAGWMARRLVTSFGFVAREMRSDPDLQGVVALRGITVLIDSPTGSSGARILSRMGFSFLPYHNPLGAFGEFWENFYTWWLMWAFNSVSVRHRSLFGLRRTEFWVEAEAFLRRFGQASSPEAGHPVRMLESR